MSMIDTLFGLVPAASRGQQWVARDLQLVNLYRWSNNLVGFDDPEYGGGDVDTYRGTFFEAFQYAMAVAAERRRSPRDDLMTLLATSEIDGHRLSDREFCNFWLLLVVAGNETTRHLISGSVQALLDNPDQRELLARDPALRGRSQTV